MLFDILNVLGLVAIGYVLLRQQERIETLEDTISKLSDRISALENP